MRFEPRIRVLHFEINSFLIFYFRNIRGDAAKEKCPEIILVKGMGNKKVPFFVKIGKPWVNHEKEFPTKFNLAMKIVRSLSQIKHFLLLYDST